MAARVVRAPYVFLGLLGFSGSRIEAAFSQAHAMPRAAPPAGPGLGVVTAPHAVYSTNPRVLAELLRAGPASVHLAEDPAERRFCAEMAGGFATLVRMLGA